jgi:phage terminase large subunit-like protein
MYGTLRLALDPSVLVNGFGLPKDIIRLRRADGGPSLRGQLEILPLLYDPEGRLYLPPKQKKNTDDKTMTIKDMLDGHSPDEADALVLACYGLTYKDPPKIRSMI